MLTKRRFGLEELLLFGVNETATLVFGIFHLKEKVPGLPTAMSGHDAFYTLEHV
ncbi:hypothetical protein GCM10022392_06930 [Mucilaginibacter panaciglaebae]|uniref:Uncharacterized protein n=1 Tax=Mucilaginibacter panaciglaebae TaxID=502331 RepID=A0ABP7WGK6_9SPHI